MFAWICPKCGKEIPPQYDGCPEWCPEYEKQKAYLKNPAPAHPEATSPILKNLMQLDSQGLGGTTYTGASYMSGATLASSRTTGTQPATGAGGPRFRPAAAAISYEETPAIGTQGGDGMATLDEIRANGQGNGDRDEARSGREMNPLLVTALATIVFLALGYAAFKYYEKSKGSFGASAGLVDQSGATGGHRLNRILSVTGLRYVPGKDKKLEARFLIVNGGAAQTPTFSGTVNIRPRDAAPDETPMLSFDISKVALGPYESREMQAPLNTTLKPYELPDGNLIRADLLITEPAD